MTLAHYIDGVIAQRRQEMTMLEEVASILIDAEQASDALIGRITGLARYAQNEFPQPVPVQAVQQQYQPQQPFIERPMQQMQPPPGYPPRPAMPPQQQRAVAPQPRPMPAPVYQNTAPGDAPPVARHVPHPHAAPQPAPEAAGGWSNEHSLQGLLKKATNAARDWVDPNVPPPVPEQRRA